METLTLYWSWVHPAPGLLGSCTLPGSLVLPPSADDEWDKGHRPLRSFFICLSVPVSVCFGDRLFLCRSKPNLRIWALSQNPHGKGKNQLLQVILRPHTPWRTCATPWINTSKNLKYNLIFYDAYISKTKSLNMFYVLPYVWFFFSIFKDIQYSRLVWLVFNSFVWRLFCM